MKIQACVVMGVLWMVGCAESVEQLDPCAGNAFSAECSDEPIRQGDGPGFDSGEEDAGAQDTGSDAPDAGSDPDPLPDTGSDPDVGTDTGTDPDVGTGPDTGTDPDVGTGPDVGTDTGTDVGTDTGTDPDTGTDVGTDTGTDTDTGIDPDTGSDPDTGTGPDTGIDPDLPIELEVTLDWTYSGLSALPDLDLIYCQQSAGSFDSSSCVNYQNDWTTWGSSELLLYDAREPYVDEILIHSNPEAGRYHVGVYAGIFDDAWFDVPAYLTIRADGVVVFSDQLTFDTYDEGGLWYGAIIDLPLTSSGGGVFAGPPCYGGGCWSYGVYPSRAVSLEP
ncbi:hypothetical protein FRC91_13720 [Bradymonadales bacterium TMQ1]|nr:hypothetical protein FRC91_13720 [Bradymonadales bacterium TMQ1]